MTFKKILDSWAADEAPDKTAEAYSIPLNVKDAARVEALAELFPGVDRERIISDLLSAALDELQAAIPYEPGDKVIQEDDYGDPVYEDVGLTPKFLDLVKARIQDQ